MSSNATLNFGVIGAGRIGKIHAANLATRIAGARLGGVADVDLPAARALADQHHVTLVSQDHRDLLHDPAIDAVAICSATDTHSPFILAAAKAGKHIFCEKPIDFDLKRIDAALQAVKAAKVKLQVGFNRRFDPNFRRVRDLVAAGKVGQPHLLRITSRDPGPPPLEYVKASGGIFLDMTIHDFDMARFLMGSEVEEIYAAGAVLVDPQIGKLGDLDTALITLRFSSGAIGAIDNSRKAVYGYDQRVEVFGSAGMAAAANETPDRHSFSNAEGVHGPLPLYFFLERYLESYRAELQAFVDCVLQDKAPPVTGLDGRIPVVMGLAARKSATENRPVRLSEIAA